jgi:hypothetical protein
MKPAPAQELLESDAGEPVLARWHVGLGYSLAWTSDVKNLWAVEWLRWPQWGQLWGQLVREHMRPRRRQSFDMRAELDPATGHVRAAVDAIGGDDRFENELTATLRVSGPGGPDRTLAMPQTAPGRYEADFPLDRYGSFLLHASLERAGGGPPGRPGEGRSTVVAESFGHITSSYPREYLATAPDLSTLARAASATGGLVDPPAATYFDPAGESVQGHQDLWARLVGAAIVVLLLDLALRRVQLPDLKKRFALRPAVR